MNNFNEEKLPDGWEVKSLADIGKIFSGNSINAKLKEEKYTNKEGTPYVATKDISYNSVINYDNGIKIPFEDLNKFRLAKSETILICAEGGSAGRKVGILNQDVYFVNKLFALETISEVNSKFCFYWYLSKEFKSNFKDKLKGLIGGVSKTDFKNLPIPIPPLEEQKHIVDKIDNLFAKIDKAISLTEESLKQAKNLLPSVLKRYLKKVKQMDEQRKLGDSYVAELIMGQSPSSDTYNLEGNGIPFFQGKKEFGDISPVVEKYCSLPKKIAYPGDILMSVRAPVGPTNLANLECCIGRGLAAIRPNSENIKTSFLLFYFKHFQSEIEKKGKGSTFSAITKSALENTIVPIPKIKKQDDVVLYLNSVLIKSKLTQSKLEEQLAYLKQLKSSILSKAFSGNL